jgi:ribosomal-protein-alanine N-acetyltransferase
MIRKATKKDILFLLEIENEVFDQENFPLSKNSFYYHIRQNNLFVYIINAKVVAYILWLERKRYYRLYSIGVVQEYQGQKIAQKLLKYSFSFLKDKYYTLEVKTTNQKAIQLYKKYGFQITKGLRDYYPDCDGYLMMKNKEQIII